MLLFIGCSQKFDIKPYSHPQKIKIKNNIRRMLKQTTDPFLIIEDPETKKFVQLYNENGNILFDLPEVALTESEIKHANKYFSKYGIGLSESKARSVETRKIFIMKSWRKIYPLKDIDKAVNLTLGALYEIYGFSELKQFNIIIGWDESPGKISPPTAEPLRKK
jgi:hypothetical protein